MLFQGGLMMLVSIDSPPSRPALVTGPREANHALPDCRRHISLCTGVCVGRIWPNRSAISSAAHDWHGHGRYAEGAPGLVYRTRYVQAVPGQCCSCGRAPCLPWLPYGLPGALLDLRTNSPQCAGLIYFCPNRERENRTAHTLGRFRLGRQSRRRLSLSQAFLSRTLMRRLGPCVGLTPAPADHIESRMP